MLPPSTQHSRLRAVLLATLGGRQPDIPASAGGATASAGWSSAPVMAAQLQQLVLDYLPWHVNLICVGDRIDAMDSGGLWYEATVLDIEPARVRRKEEDKKKETEAAEGAAEEGERDEKQGENEIPLVADRVRVHFIGWRTRWDSWVYLGPSLVAPFPVAECSTRSIAQRACRPPFDLGDRVLVHDSCSATYRGGYREGVVVQARTVKHGWLPDRYRFAHEVELSVRLTREPRQEPTVLLVRYDLNAIDQGQPELPCLAVGCKLTRAS